jgi:hypothetical protein
MAAGAIIGGVANLAVGIIGSSSARRAAKRAAREAARLQRKLTRLENNRQQIINPYAGVEDISGLAKDLSSQISNPFANLSVATQAAEMQIEESDISLANTLDVIRATGAGAGGATALAQAALRSKKGVAASIEQQEVANEKLKAQGEQSLERARLQEQVRMQNIQMSEAQRLQQADVAGKQFVFGMTEQREQQQLDRVSNQIAALKGQAASASRDSTAALTGGIGAAASLLGGIGGGS